MKKSAKGKKVVMVSGGFDPVHIGHVRLFNAAKKLGDELVVYINNDNWLKLKKGYVFMPEDERKEIIESFASVDRVIISNHKKNTKDISVVEGIKLLKPDIFAKGGDRHAGNIPEVDICREIGCKIVSGVGRGGKVQSSSALVRNMQKIKKSSRKSR